MIKIFSINNDHTTNVVIDWLFYLGEKWRRINAEDVQEGIGIDEFCVETYNVIWFRKWQNGINTIKDDNSDSCLTANIGKEFDEFSKYIFNRYSKTKWLNHPDNLLKDKLSQLDLAKEIGLSIPETKIVSNKKDLLRFKENHQNVITKPLAAVIHRKVESKSFLNYTRRIEDDEIETIEDEFYPTLIQREVKKEYEIRSFYLDGKFYSMAIFSQNDKQTSLDFRHYNKKKPNRTVSFYLPKKIENLLHKLMLGLEMNSGSIDLIKNEFGEYIFLEVNPLGQLGMVSYPCNYFLESKIAEHLIKLNNAK